VPPKPETASDFRFRWVLRATTFCTLITIGVVKCALEPDTPSDLLFYFYITFSTIFVYPTVWNVACWWQGRPNSYWLIEHESASDSKPRYASVAASLITYATLSTIMIVLLFLVSFDPERDWTKWGDAM